MTTEPIIALVIVVALAVFIVRGVWAQEARDTVVPEPEPESGVIEE